MIGFIDEISDVLVTAYNKGMYTVDNIPCSICREHKRKRTGNEITRTHFHGSEFGMCKRKVYYTILTNESGSFSNKAFLDDGHLHEESIMNYLQLGISKDYKVIHFKENEEEDRHEGEFILEDKQGSVFIVCHLDGMLIDLKQDKQYLLECKSVKQAKYREIKPDNKISEQWKGQIQCYLNLNNLNLGVMNTAYLFVKHRESSLTLPPIKIEKDMDYIQERTYILEDIRERIINGDNEPDKEHTTAKDSECLYCPFKERCWR